MIREVIEAKREHNSGEGKIHERRNVNNFTSGKIHFIIKRGGY